MSRFREFLHACVWAKRHLLGQMRVAEVSFVRPHITPTGTVLDVGAHGGAWTVPLSAARGRVLSFEALPYYARVLRMTLKLLRIRNVSVVNHPVLNRHEPIDMVVRPASGERLTGMTHVRGKDEAVAESVRVESIVLDDFLKDFSGNIEFIKMDIEGAELLALQGATRLLNRHRPILYLEINEQYCQRYGHSAATVFSFLNGLNYGSFSSTDGKWVPLVPEQYNGSGDVWFLPKEKEANLTIRAQS